MAFTSGFFDSVNHNRVYSAEQFSSIFSGIISDGVLKNCPIDGDPNNNDRFMILPLGGMNVQVGRGRAWFNNTWSQNTTRITLPIEASHGTLNRYDAVVIEIDTRIDHLENSIKLLKGTPQAEAVKPIPIKRDGLYQYVLGYIYIPARETEIKSSNIENVIGTEQTPYCRSLASEIDLKIKNDLVTTDPGYVLDARQGRELNAETISLGLRVTSARNAINSNQNWMNSYLRVVRDGVEIPFNFGINSKGQYGYYKKNMNGGADTFYPFNRDPIIRRVAVENFYKDSTTPITIDMSKVPHNVTDYKALTIDNFFLDNLSFEYKGGLNDSNTAYPQGSDIWSKIRMSSGFEGLPINMSYIPETGLLTIQTENMDQSMSLKLYNGSYTIEDETYIRFDERYIPIRVRGTVYVMYADYD